MDVAPSLARAYSPCPHSRFPVSDFRFLTSDFQFPLAPVLSTVNYELSTYSLSPLECVGLTASLTKTAHATHAESILTKLEGLISCTINTYKKRGGTPLLCTTVENRKAKRRVPGALQALLADRGRSPAARKGAILVTSFICNFWHGKVFDTMWGSWPGRTSN